MEFAEASLKQRKEEFVSNLTGGSTVDIYMVTSVSLTSYLAWCILKKKTDIFQTLVGNFIDFFLNWNNLLLSITLYHNKSELLTFLTLLPVITVTIVNSLSGTKDAKKSKPKEKVRVNLNSITIKHFLPYKTYLTVYRSQMMVITCLAILAVDFKIFPRRFAKVETWGTSMMDLGVGSFVFSMGLVSSRQDIKEKFDSSSSGKSFSKLLKSVKQSIPILVLGGIRLVSVKSLDYQEHLAEYGKHWNFFITLGLLPFVSTLLNPIVDLLPQFFSSLLIALLYEIVLVKTDLMAFVISDKERIGLIAENKEGIFSFIGYYSIFLAGKAAGGYLLPVIPTPSNLLVQGSSRSKIMEAYRSNKIQSLFTVTPLKGLVISSFTYQILYFIIDRCYVFGVSRRMANLLYVLWVCAYNTTFLTGYKLIDSWVWGEAEIDVISEKDIKDDEELEIKKVTNDKRHTKKDYLNATPLTLHAVNNNSLVCFLLANLGTGLINMSVNTLDASVFKSMAVLVAYEFTLALITLILLKLGIVLR